MPDKRQKTWAKKIRKALRELLAVTHRSEKLGEATFAGKLRAARAEIVPVATT